VNGHLHSLVFTERSVLAGHLPWMGWNLLLAAIPLLLAWVLFRPAPRRGALWWPGVVVFVAFLPNAAYVLTDAVHLAQDFQRVQRPSILVGAIIPLYCAYFLAGLACYSIALTRLRRYLIAAGQTRMALAAEVALHLLVAVGIFLGRVDRLNSWDILARPTGVIVALVHLANGEAAVTLLVLAGMVVVARLALTGIGQIGWAGLNRVWTPVLVPAPFRHVPDPELSSASPRRRTYASSRDATGAVVS
jgi:uncharacterized membrane protein